MVLALRPVVAPSCHSVPGSAGMASNPVRQGSHAFDCARADNEASRRCRVDGHVHATRADGGEIGCVSRGRAPTCEASYRAADSSGLKDATPFQETGFLGRRAPPFQGIPTKNRPARPARARWFASCPPAPGRHLRFHRGAFAPRWNPGLLLLTKPVPTPREAPPRARAALPARACCHAARARRRARGTGTTPRSRVRNRTARRLGGK